MNSKLSGLFALSVFTLVLLTGFASAAVSFEPSTINQSIVHGQTSVTFNFELKETAGDAFTLSNWVKTATQGTLTLSSEPTTLDPNQTISLSATLSSIPSDFIGTINGSISVDDNTTTTTTLPYSVVVTAPTEIVSCNAVGNLGNLEVKRIDFTNNGIPYAAFGEDDDQWFPFEEIEVEIEVESDDYDIDDISVEWGIYSLEDNDWLIDLDEEDEVNIKDGDQEKFFITFKLDDDLDIDLEDFVDNSDNYRFYVRAEGTIDDSNSLDDGEDTCAFDYESATILIEDFVILDNIDMPETLSCGETATITADVWNIGDSDQDEVSVEVSGRENALDFSEIFEVGDIDKFDKQELSFTFTVPKNIDEKFYALKFAVNDEDGDVFENNDDDFSEFTVPFEVSECGAVAAGEATISATLVSGGQAGEEMIVKATVTNNGDDLSTFTINAAEFATWADSVSQDQTTLVLNAGQSRDILFTFDVSRDASGSQTFYIELVSDGDMTRQPVSVSIEPRSGFLTGAAIGGNAYLWGLGLLNIILVVIIIIVAVRIARR